ncbi:hypothetical protein FJW06_18460 [Mesorhizobium sp. B4-1-3]|uniref:hypothetical protein n=1 Tax=Mesorhizobium sp. B4-1-3 TaxID=2589889 RepID=UPI00112A362F|nr:hypothetical protein [Mesorhizobium sp. B4-1-3]TPI12009.1 hypothetical protein FJW06_18460 [Mesorhizobium sp. B4-1-3]
MPQWPWGRRRLPKNPTTLREGITNRIALYNDGIVRMGAGVVGDALRMAYVDPCATLGRQSQIIPDDNLEGRDPTW